MNKTEKSDILAPGAKSPPGPPGSPPPVVVPEHLNVDAESETNVGDDVNSVQSSVQAGHPDGNSALVVLGRDHERAQEAIEQLQAALQAEKLKSVQLEDQLSIGITSPSFSLCVWEGGHPGILNNMGKR